MTDALLGRILIDQNVMAGKPVITGTRLTVQHILTLLANGIAQEDILKEYPQLKRDDILACLFFATKALDNTAIYEIHSR